MLSTTYQDYIQLWHGDANLLRESLEAVQQTAAVILGGIARGGTPLLRRRGWLARGLTLGKAGREGGHTNDVSSLKKSFGWWFKAAISLLSTYRSQIPCTSTAVMDATHRRIEWWNPSVCLYLVEA